MSLLSKLRAKGNKRILFTLNRYLSYVLKFVLTIFIAAQLGPYHLGLWGFYLMIIEYYQYSLFGLQYSVNVDLSVIDKNTSTAEQQLGCISFNALLISAVLGGVYMAVAVFSVCLFPQMGSEYELSSHLVPVVGIAVLNALATVFMNIYRSFDEFFEIGFSELTFTIVPFCALFLFSGSELIDWMLWLMLGARVLHIALYIVRFRFPLMWNPDAELSRHLLMSGFGLMLFNISYNLFFIISKSVVGANYAVEVMGQFTFAFTLTNAAVYGIQTMLFTVYSKLLYDFGSATGAEEIYDLVRGNARAYNLAVSTVIYLMMGALPVLFMVFPKFTAVLPLLVLFLVSRVIFTIGTMYGTLIFARKQQTQAVRYSLGLLLAAMPFMWLAGHFHAEIAVYGVITLIYSVGYAVLQLISARKVIGLQKPVAAVLFDNAAWTIILPGLLAMVAVYFAPRYWLLGVPVLFFVLNLRSLQADLPKMLKLIS